MAYLDTYDSKVIARRLVKSQRERVLINRECDDWLPINPKSEEAHIAEQIKDFLRSHGDGVQIVSNREAESLIGTKYLPVGISSGA